VSPEVTQTHGALGGATLERAAAPQVPRPSTTARPAPSPAQPNSRAPAGEDGPREPPCEPEATQAHRGRAALERIAVMAGSPR
jgi:hypothetical protein